MDRGGWLTAPSQGLDTLCAHTAVADNWWKFDDDTVTPVKTEEILKLDGGGDWHMAYMCLYRERTLPADFKA